MTALTAAALPAACILLGAAVAFLVCVTHALDHLAHAVARARGGTWRIGGGRCPGCHKRVHVFRVAHGQQLCCSCAPPQKTSTTRK